MLGIPVVSLPGWGHLTDKGTILDAASSGIAFALTSLWVCEASLSVGADLTFNAAPSALIVILQIFICFTYICCKQRAKLSTLRKHSLLAVFAGRAAL